MMSSAEKALPTSGWRALARRFFARVFFAGLLGVSVPVFGTMFDTLFSDFQFSILAAQLISILVLVTIVNTFSIGIITFTSRLSMNARPQWWVLPTFLGFLTGGLIAAVNVMGADSATNYQSPESAFVIGGMAGVLVGAAYTLSIPGIRQDTILKQSRRAILLGGVVGILYGSYYLLREQSPLEPSTLPYYLAASYIGLPLSIMGMLLSFVLGVELGDRYVERRESTAE